MIAIFTYISIIFSSSDQTHELIKLAKHVYYKHESNPYYRGCYKYDCYAFLVLDNGIEIPIKGNVGWSEEFNDFKSICDLTHSVMNKYLSRNKALEDIVFSPSSNLNDDEFYEISLMKSECKRKVLTIRILMKKRI